MTRSFLAAVVLRFDAGAHQLLVDGPPIGRRVDGDLFGVRGAAAVGAQRVENAPQVLVDLQSLEQRRFTTGKKKKKNRKNE